MGMFDYVRCEVPLPDGFAGELQTKDLNCEMCVHVITADGRLITEHVTHTSEVPKAERPFPDAPDDDIRSLCGSVRFHKERRDADFHGVLNFYGVDGDEWHEYNAKFTDGKLVKIDVMPSSD